MGRPEEEGDSENRQNLTAEGRTESSARRPDVRTINADCVLKYKEYIIPAVILVVVLIIIIIALAVLSTKPYVPCLPIESAACPDSWIGYRRKCFYVSKEERNWSLSLNTCSSFNASLAVIDNQEELEFWFKIFQPHHYWFGLSREKNIWKWSNGTEFTNEFPVRGEGFCAYLNGKGASSTICSMEKHFLCSKPENCRKPG